MECIVQKDAGGNNYSPLSGADPDALYVPDTKWSGKVYDTNWSAEEADKHPEEWGLMLLEENPRALILYPIS